MAGFWFKSTGRTSPVSSQYRCSEAVKAGNTRRVTRIFQRPILVPAGVERLPGLPMRVPHPERKAGRAAALADREHLVLLGGLRSILYGHEVCAAAIAVCAAVVVDPIERPFRQPADVIGGTGHPGPLRVIPCVGPGRARNVDAVKKGALDVCTAACRADRVAGAADGGVEAAPIEDRHGTVEDFGSIGDRLRVAHKAGRTRCAGIAHTTSRNIHPRIVNVADPTHVTRRDAVRSPGE